MSPRTIAAVLISGVILTGAAGAVWWLTDQEQAIAVPARYTGAAATMYRATYKACAQAPRPGGRLRTGTDQASGRAYIEFGGRRVIVGSDNDPRNAGCVAGLDTRGWAFLHSPPPDPPTCPSGQAPKLGITTAADGDGAWVWRCVTGSS